MVRFELNGEPAAAPEGTTVLLAALEHGEFIPHLCYHPALSAVGSCRLCMARVEVDGRSELATTCNLPVREGMTVCTTGAEVEAARASAMEFILARHPLECPTCEVAGECELQDFALAHGRDRGRHLPRAEEDQQIREVLGPHLTLDRSRCVGCTRCVRFEEEITGTRRLAMAGMGAQARPVRVGGEPLDHSLSGNLLDLCPAGALVDPANVAAPPTWRLSGSDTICPGCATACPVRADVLAGSLHRLVPRLTDPPWLCDEGRFGWRLGRDPDRIVEPQVREEGALRPVPWDRALEEAAGALTGTGRVAWITDGWETMEEAHLRALVARHLGEETLCLRSRAAFGGDRVSADGFVESADRCPNRRGLVEHCSLMGIEPVSPEVLFNRLESGRVNCLFWHGGDPGRELGEREIGALARVPSLIVIDQTPSALTELARVVLPGASAFERDGTVISGRGRPGRLRAAAAAPGPVRPDWQILSDLAAALNPDLVEGLDSPSAVLDDLLDRVRATDGDVRPPALAGLGAGLAAQHERQTGKEARPGTARGAGWFLFLQRRGFLQCRSLSSDEGGA